MTRDNLPDSGRFGDDDGGFEGPDVETKIESEPVVDTGDDDLLDSADSYVSPARTEDEPEG